VGSVLARTFGDGPIRYDILVEAAIIRLVKAKNFAAELMYWDDGSLVSMLTGSAYDPQNHKLIAGGIWERHFIVCDIEER